MPCAKRMRDQRKRISEINVMNSPDGPGKDWIKAVSELFVAKRVNHRKREEMYGIFDHARAARMCQIGALPWKRRPVHWRIHEST